MLAAGKADVFWKVHEDAEEEKDLFSPEFKDLFEKMMTLNPKERPSLEEVLAHPFMQGEIATAEEAQAEFQRRKNIVDEESHRDREVKREQRADAAPRERTRSGSNIEAYK